MVRSDLILFLTVQSHQAHPPDIGASLPAALLVITLGISVIYGRSLFTVPFKQMEYAVMQDMSEGEDLQELLTGEVITQTFTTSRSFNHIGCKVLNPLGDANPSSHRIEVLDSDGNVLGSRDLGGSEVLNKELRLCEI